MSESRARLRYAYNTNGLQSHRLGEALEMLAEEGYAGVALTLDHMHLDPLRCTEHELMDLRRLCDELGLAISVETGARYVLDPRRKHRPAWTDADAAGRRRRSDYLARCIEIAGALGAESVVCFSGIDHDRLGPVAFEFVLEALSDAQSQADEAGVPLALEPEPGHVVATLGDYRRCAGAVPGLRLALDLGHVPVTEPERELAATIREFSGQLAAVHIEDSNGKIHEHLPFGEGRLDHPAILAALADIDFRGLVAIELSRHSHAAHELVPSSIAFLREREA